MNKNLQDILEGTCRVGQGELCCRYLCIGERGFECAKLNPEGKKELDIRVARDSMISKGDNCEGRDLLEFDCAIGIDLASGEDFTAIGGKLVEKRRD